MEESLTRFRHLNMQVQRRLSACLHQAEQYFKRTFPVPTVSYEVRGVKAGVAHLQKNAVNFNRTLLLENPQQFIRQVVPHELAHLIVYQLFGRVKPHGHEWQSVMTDLFHLPADTCHQFNLETVRGRTFPYRCRCQTHQLGIRRHLKMQRQQAIYYCRKCKEMLHFYAEK